ncbi:serine recombinase [Agromyces rhizosphaerae]|uniref:Serine recombinase n=1 Tax=Agromyces rhizosphaerae TaxID=88374 RepID=A0A9W6CYU6_9MICO|nr:recombinase family protein [Agromyces rhizosphaerae]GLI28506.1 serine recombinase [Agromyces rhizosphaerae]
MQIAIYTRISEDDEHLGKGVQRQEQDCRGLVTRLEWSGEVSVYKENDTSATRGKRPVFERMMADAHAGQIDAIVFWDSDRITRTPREAEDVIDLVTTRGIKVIGFHGDDLTTSDGQMLFRIKITVARNEIDKMKRRIRRASDQRAADGQMAGQTGYGFKRLEGGSVSLVPEQVVVIQDAARRVLEGASLRQICMDLQKRGVSTPGRGSTWNTTTLKQLLLRESLAGLRRHRGAVVGELHESIPRILTVDEHERLKAILNDPMRRTAPVGRAPKYLLGGIARCGRCGGVMRRAVGRMTTTKSGGSKRQPPSYVCGDCYRVRRKQADVDALVEGIIAGRLQMPDAAQLFVTGDPIALAEAQDAIEAIDARLANAADMFAAGDIDGGQLARITERLRADRARAAADLEAALPGAVPADLMGDAAAETWAALSMDSKRAVLSTLVTVTIMPSGSGKAFDPATVRVDWRS